jgi:hypothetical protein
MAESLQVLKVTRLSYWPNVTDALFNPWLLQGHLQCNKYTCCCTRTLMVHINVLAALQVSPVVTRGCYSYGCATSGNKAELLL